MNLINKNRQTSINVMFTSLSPACPVTVKECTTYHSMLGERGRGPSTHHQDGNWESLHLPAHYTGLTLTEPTQQKGLRVSLQSHLVWPSHLCHWKAPQLARLPVCIIKKRLEMKELSLKHFLSGWTKWTYPVFIWSLHKDRSQLRA